MKIKRMRFMTRREWVKEHYPSKATSSYIGGVGGHPHEYGFTDGYENFINCVRRKLYANNDMCGECYDKPAVINGKYILVKKEGKTE